MLEFISTISQHRTFPLFPVKHLTPPPHAATMPLFRGAPVWAEMAIAGPFEPDPGYAGEGMGRQPFLADAFLESPLRKTHMVKTL